MAKLTVEQIAEIIRPCGLVPMKSKGIHAFSNTIVNEYDGKVPASFEALEAMPSVGHKTASVVMSQAFGVPAFPVDTHIQRLMHRWGFSNGKSVVQTERDAKRLFPKDLWNKLHLQIIFYGREYSPARGWDLEKDIITRTVGRKSEIQRWYKDQELKAKKGSTTKKARR
jgi:endonuclease-3